MSKLLYYAAIDLTRERCDICGNWTFDLRKPFEKELTVLEYRPEYVDYPFSFVERDHLYDDPAKPYNCLVFCHTCAFNDFHIPPMEYLVDVVKRKQKQYLPYDPDVIILNGGALPWN